jgi:hypothetical protein
MDEMGIEGFIDIRNDIGTSEGIGVIASNLG